MSGPRFNFRLLTNEIDIDEDDLHDDYSFGIPLALSLIVTCSPFAISYIYDEKDYDLDDDFGDNHDVDDDVH